jgi:predicted DNA-binding transcriptional regulator YafY
MSNSTAIRDSINAFFEEEKSAELTTFDVLFLVYLRLLDGKTEDPSATLQRRFNVSARTIRQSIQRLERLGYVSIEYRRGGSNVVRLAAATQNKQEKAA